MDMAGAVSRFLGIVAVCILAQASWLADAAVQQTDRLVFGIHPYLPAAEVQKRFKPLIDYLSSQLDRQIELRVSKNYETHIENVGNNIFDIAYMGPSSYVGMTEKFGMRPLLARLEVNGKPDFHGYIVTRKDSPVQALEQLAGRRFAFGSAHSTMSYLVPRHMLKRAGVGLEQLGNYTFLGNHRNVALGVLIGEFDAGAVKEEVFDEFRSRGLRKLATSPSISEHVFVGRFDMPEEQRQKIQQAMFSLSGTEQGRKILAAIKKTVTALVPANDSDYDNLRTIMRN
jgi:phosphonate transport system substrate-binding protein